MPRLAIYCADVGSIKQGNFGWAREEVPAGEIERHRGGTEIVDVVDALAEDLGAGVPVALGFECPLFVPAPEDPFRLGAARPGEGTRPWSAGAGTGALTTGLVQAGVGVGEAVAVSGSRRAVDRVQAADARRAAPSGSS